MRKYLLFALVLILCGCGNVRYITKTERQIKVSERTELIPYMVRVEIPEAHLERRTRDSVSFLETKYAQSTARILADGTLYHDLENIAQTVEHQTEVPIVYRDSIVFETTEVTKEVPVEKKLNWWQRIRLDGFFVLLTLLAFAYRKRILTLIGL